MESDSKMLFPGTTDKPNDVSTPKPNKRCAMELTPNLEKAAQVCVPKKRLILECDTTPLVSPVSNRTCLSASILSTPGRTVSTSRLNITRGIQTIRPDTVNRYCQVSVARIRKSTATIHVQTDESLLCSLSAPPPPPVVFTEIGCQTDEPLIPKTCVGTTQTESFFSAPVQRGKASCQTDMAEDSIQARNDRNVEAPRDNQEQAEREGLEDDGSALESMTNMLNTFAKQYGIDLQSPDKKKKKKSNIKKKEIEHLQECLANKTYKAIASKVDEKMEKILEKHMTAYGRETLASRNRLMRWTKVFIRRQQQDRAASNAPSRKVLLVRKIVRVPKRPTVEEKSVQCVPELMTVRKTVGTQWQRQKPPVTKKKPVSTSRKKATRNEATPTKPTSTDSKTCSAGAGNGIRHSMRQTKLSSYAKEQDGDGKTIQGRQQRQRKQQGECSPKPSKSATVPAVIPSSSSAKTTKASRPPPSKRKTRNEKKVPKELPEICVEETPSPSPSPQRPEPEAERKHFPYRSPQTYPTQCSKATETSFLTPSRIRNLAPELMDNDRQLLNCHNEMNNNRSYNPAVLLSPLERMYVEPATMASTNRPAYNTFLVPLRSNQSVPPTPSAMMYLNNPPERRVLLRSCPGNGGLVREKPPEVSIISSQQLYSQIGLAVEKALKNKSLPTLATMYGEPFIEVFNGCEQVAPEATTDSRRAEEELSSVKATKQQQAKITDEFVCSSGKEDANLKGSQLLFRRPPFHTERSPSLSPIVYQDENSEDEIIL